MTDKPKENKLESQKIEKTSEKTSSESSIGDSSKQESWADAAELAHKDDIDPSEVDGLPALDSFGIRNDDGSTTVAKRHEVKPKNKPAELQKLTPKYDHSKPAEKKEATKRNHEYVKPPSDDSRPVYHDDTDKRLINPIGGFIPERADYLGFTIQRYPNVTESQIHDLHQMILRIPDAERKALQSIGVSFALSEFVKDARPEDHLRSTRTAGAEMDSVLGFFEPGTHQIVLPSKRQYSQGIDSGGTGWTLNLDNRKFSSTFFHEVGHALDKYFWKFSQSDEFGNAYKKDLLTLVNKSKKTGNTDVYDRLRYNIAPELDNEQPGDPSIYFERQRVGREEMFAELYAVMRTPSGEHTAKMKLLRDNFPSVYKVMEQSLERFNSESA